MRMLEESPITTQLSGTQEPPSDQSTSQMSPKLDKGKAKMREYEDQKETDLIHSLNSDFEGLDIHIDGVNLSPRM